MREYPLVTIVTPSYNQGKYIEATIKSVLDQKYPNLEYLIMDGGSNDQTLDILKKYEGKLKWISEKDKGQSDAINKGFKKANGSIVAWLNSDDTYEPGAIHAAVDYFLNNEQVALVYGHGDIIDENGHKVKRFEATQEFDLWSLIHRWDYIMQPTTFFKKDALHNVGYLDEELNWCMDWDLWIKLGLRFEVGFINRVLANSREYAETKTSTGGWRRFKEIISLMRKHGTMKYPPGYYLYGASTLYTELTRFRLLKKPASVIMYMVHRQVHRTLPIQHADGWIGSVHRFYIPLHKKYVLLRFRPELPSLLPLKVSIYLNEKLKDVITVNERKVSETKLEIIDPTSAIEVKITVNKTSKPKPDTRYLSLMLEKYLQ